MANQGKSIEEIKGPDLSVPTKPEIIKPTTEITESKNITQPIDNSTIVVMEPVREYIIKDKVLEDEDRGLENANADSPVP